MKKRSKPLILCLYILIGILLPAKQSLASVYELGGIDLPDLGTPTPRIVRYEEIWSAIKDGNINLAVNLIENKVLEEFRKKLGSESKIKHEIAVWLKNGGGQEIVDELNKILNDRSKSEEEKALDISEIIESTLSLYESQMKGSHRMKIQHSIGLGVTRLTWDQKEEVDSCQGGGIQCTGTFGDSFGGSSYRCNYTYWTDYVLKIPDYYIYKIVNGESKLLRKYKGFSSVSRNRISVSSNDPWASLAEGLYAYDKFDKVQISQGRRYFDDMFSNLYDKGDSIAYKIVSDNSPYKGKYCGSSERITSSVALDSNGDYFVDFIPKKEYAKFRKEFYPWLVPIIYLLQ